MFLRAGQFTMLGLRPSVRPFLGLQQIRSFGIGWLYKKKKPLDLDGDDLKLVRKFVKYPDSVKVSVEECPQDKDELDENPRHEVVVTGPRGTLRIPLTPGLEIKSSAGFDGLNDLEVVPVKDDLRLYGTMWGTTAALIANMVSGVIDGHYAYLEINGIGYRAAIEGDNIVLRLGYSHPCYVKITPGVKVKLLSPTLIVMYSIDIRAVTQLASKVRKFRPPEPYKQKGVFVNGETIKKKEVRK